MCACSDSFQQKHQTANEQLEHPTKISKSSAERGIPSSILLKQKQSVDS